MTEIPPDRFMSEDLRTGWFPLNPDGSHIHGDDDDPVIRSVSLKAHEYAGPFCDDEGHLSDDFSGVTTPAWHLTRAVR